MKVGKFINFIISRFGYEIVNKTVLKRKNDNFVNLTLAYEQRLNELNNSNLTYNEDRISLLARLLGTPPSEAYFLIEAIEKCKKIDGDVCEFGVAQGETSALIANEIRLSKDKKLHLFDSFEGLPEPTGKDELKDDIFSLGSIAAYAGTMSCPISMVKNRLDAIRFPAERVIIHKGFIENVLSIGQSDRLPTKVSFAYLDFDFYAPIKTSLQFLQSVLSKGAVVIVDDYNYFSTGAKKAVDEWIEETNAHEKKYECVIPNTRYGHFAVITKKLS